MLDILRQQIVKWGTEANKHAGDVHTNLPDDLWVALHRDGGMNTLVMMQAMTDGDFDYISYANFMIDFDTGKTIDWKPQHYDFRYATEDEQASAFLKLIAVMA